MGSNTSDVIDIDKTRNGNGNGTNSINLTANEIADAESGQSLYFPQWEWVLAVLTLQISDSPEYLHAVTTSPAPSTAPVKRHNREVLTTSVILSFHHGRHCYNYQHCRQQHRPSSLATSISTTFIATINRNNICHIDLYITTYSDSL